MTKALKWILLSFGAIFLLLFAGFMVLVVDFGGHSKSRLLVESTSTDGRLVAEVREVVTPMHGGPDSVQVSLRSVTRAAGDVIYSQVFECGPDYSAFQVKWESPTVLVISYGTCDAGRYRSPTDNKILQMNTVWHDVTIRYQNSEYVAHAKL